MEIIILGPIFDEIDGVNVTIAFSSLNSLVWSLRVMEFVVVLT